LFVVSRCIRARTDPSAPRSCFLVRFGVVDLRIVHIITRLIVGGAQENTVLTCEGLAHRGHDVYLWAGPTTGPEGSLVPRVRAASRLPGGAYAYEEFPDLVRQISPLHELRALNALRRRLEQLRPDVVHTHSSKAGILGRIAAHRAGVPVIVHTIHGMSFNRTQAWPTRALYAALERFCAEKSHALVSVADAMTRQALAAGVGRSEQYVTVRSGMVTADFDPARFDGREVRRAWGVPDDAIVVGTVARLFKNKGYEQLIEAMPAAVRGEPRLRFVWVGDGAHRAEYEAALARLGLRDRVTITGLLPPDEMPRVLSGMDLVAHASQWEGLPRAVVQGLLMGKPAVCFDLDGAPEVVIPGETGELAAPGNIDAFSDAIVKLARDAALRGRYGAEGRRRCLVEFDHHRMVEALEGLYRSLRK